jgi:hypothetical protein
MKKILVFVMLCIIGNSIYAQTKNEIEDSLFESNFTYEKLKEKVKLSDETVSDAALMQLLMNSEKEESNKDLIMESSIRIISLNARSCARFTQLSRERNRKPNKDFDNMVNNYFSVVEKEFKEPPLLAMMNKSNQTKLAGISKFSFEGILDWIANFQGCNVFCCDKADYPHFNFFLLGGSYPASVSMMKKVEPGMWRDNLICGFNLYNFPITYPIKKAKIRILPIINLVLGILNGTGPTVAFKDDGVFISRIPVLILRGFKINEPCKDTESWLLNNRVKAKH